MNYQDPRYLELADMIENHELAIDRLIETLNIEFPPPDGKDWEIVHCRPVLLGKN